MVGDSSAKNNIIAVVSGGSTGTQIFQTADGRRWMSADVSYHEATGDRCGKIVGNQIIEKSFQTEHLINTPPKRYSAKKKVVKRQQPFYMKFVK